MKLSFAVAALALAATSIVPPGGSGSILFGDPSRTGNQTTTVKLSYFDSQGAKKDITITATTPLTPSDTPQEKKAKVQSNLNDEFNKALNKVNGQSLGSAGGGTGNAMTIDPAPDSQGNFTDVKIEKITSDDSETGEKDTVTSPKNPALAQIQAIGDITGSDGSGASLFEVETNLGTVTVNLTAGMRKTTLLRELASGLEAQGATWWVDTDSLSLFVYVPGGEEQVASIGAGSTDEGLIARVGVLSGN